MKQSTEIYEDLIEVLTDELVKAREQLRQLEKKYRNLVDNSLVGVYQSKLNGEFLYVNEALSKMLEFESPESLRNAGAIKIYKSPKERETLLDKLQQTGYVSNYEIELLTKTGKSRNILISATLDGDILSGMNMDITQIKHIELSLKKMNEELRTTNTELKTTQAQLIQTAKLTSIGELATGIAHELNQPLFAISLTIERTIKALKKDSQTEIMPRLEQIDAQVGRASKIINYLRNFGRDARNVQKEPTALPLLVENSLILINEQLRLHGIEVKKILSEALPTIPCTPIQIEQVLTNLIINARDAMETSATKMLTIRAYPQTPWGVIEIEDTGTGIPDTVREHIFDPFFTTKEVGKGTGIGLSISYRIIQDHHGKIEVESQEGKGSLFRVLLPLS